MSLTRPRRAGRQHRAAATCPNARVFPLHVAEDVVLVTAYVCYKRLRQSRNGIHVEAGCTVIPTLQFRRNVACAAGLHNDALRLGGDELWPRRASAGNACLCPGLLSWPLRLPRSDFYSFPGGGLRLRSPHGNGIICSNSCPCSRMGMLTIAHLFFTWHMRCGTSARTTVSRLHD